MNTRERASKCVIITEFMPELIIFSLGLLLVDNI